MNEIINRQIQPDMEGKLGLVKAIIITGPPGSAPTISFGAPTTNKNST